MPSSRDAALVGLGLGAGLAAGYLISRHRSRQQQQQQQQQQSTGEDPSRRNWARRPDPVLTREQFSRGRMFFGEAGQQKLANAFVVVIGLGGVGSHAAHMLVRAGVGRIRLVDFDRVTLSSLNRHCCATHADVGANKADVLAAYFRRFAPGCEIEAINETCTAETAPDLLAGSPDFVLDCIDDVPTKAALLRCCRAYDDERWRLRVVSAMGAGGKADPTRLHIADLADIKHDELARALRKELRHGLGAARALAKSNGGGRGEAAAAAKKGADSEEVPRGIMSVYSSENSRAKLQPLTEEQRAEPEEFGARAHFRIRIMPVLGTMPAVMGMAMASYALTEIVGQPMSPIAVAPLTEKIRNRFLQTLRTREQRYADTAAQKKATKKKKNSKTAVDIEEVNKFDVEFLLVSVWAMRNSLTERSFGSGDKAVLTRWDQSKPAGRRNLVLVTEKQADAMARLFPDGRPRPGVSAMEPAITPELIRRVETVLAGVNRFQM